MGLARFTFVPLAAMQWFWFAKVVYGVRRKLSAAAKAPLKLA